MEQYLIAARFHDVAPKDILPEIELVQNGYVSMIGYQTKGFLITTNAQLFRHSREGGNDVDVFILFFL